jgi:hypothetical protein
MDGAKKKAPLEDGSGQDKEEVPMNTLPEVIASF